MIPRRVSTGKPWCRRSVDDVEGPVVAAIRPI